VSEAADWVSSSCPNDRVIALVQKALARVIYEGLRHWTFWTSDA